MVVTLHPLAAFLIGKNRLILIAVLMLVVASGVVYSTYLGDSLRFLPDEKDYFTLAENIATRGVYTLDGEHPTAYRPPGYPLFLSIFYSIGAGLVHFRILNFLILGLSIYLVYKILQEISSSLSAVLGALLVVAYPVAFFTAGTLYPQTLASLLLLLFFYWTIAKNRSYYFVLAGFCLGYLVLTVPTFVFILPVLLVWYPFNKGALRGKGLVLVVLSAILLVGSWTARNYYAFGSFIFVSSNSGENLLLGNSENTTPNDGSGVDISKYEAQAANLGEIERDKFLREQALKYMWEHKLQTVTMYFLKLLNFFNFRNELVTQSEESSLQDILMLVPYAPLLLILILRLLMLRVHKPVPAEALLILLYLGSAFTSALFFTRIRFRIPSDFLLIVIAALFVERVRRENWRGYLLSMHKQIYCSIVSLLFLAGCSYPALAPAPPNADTTTASPSATAPANTAVAVSPTSPPTLPPEPLAPLHGIHIHTAASMTAEILDQTNVKWTRFDGFNWDLIEPVKTDPPAYDWSAVDEEYLRLASASGVEVVSLIQFAPEWAQKYPGYACGPITPDAIDDFANFVRELVSRYSQPPFDVDYWEIGNEPEIDHTLVPPRSGFGCWGEAGDPYYGGGYYAEVLKAVYPQIKAVDPEAQVLVGGLLLDCDPVSPPETEAGSGEYKDCTPSKFLEGILNNGGGDSFDGVSFHAYDYYAGSLGKYSNANWHSSWDTSGPVVVAKSRYLKSVLNAFGVQDKFLINTESAILCGQDGREDFCQTEEFALTKAGYLSQSYAIALAEGLRANIWYSLTGWRGSGLVGSDLQPSLAYQAFGFSAGVLREAAYSGEITTYPGIKGYEFVQDGARTWLVWALDEDTHSLQLQDQPSAIYDVLGNPLPVGPEIDVTLIPLYLQWNP